MKKLQTTLDKITTLISAILCAAMMVILFANVVLRLIPGIDCRGSQGIDKVNRLAEPEKACKTRKRTCKKGSLLKRK